MPLVYHLFLPNNPNRLGWISMSRISYTPGTRELHKGRADHIIILICHNSSLFYCLFYFSYIYVPFQSQHYQSYKILYIINELSTPKYFVSHKTRSTVDQSINIDKSTIDQSINQYLPVYFYVHSINIKCF